MKLRRSKHSKDKKNDQLENHREDSSGEYLTTNQGLKISHTDDSLKAGERGPTLIEDFHFREKLTHFDHERIPERVVHARGSAAHGYFEVYRSLKDLTRAKFLQDPSVKTPVFVRFSTVVGFRGSADTVRDVRGFATKFYTEEGVYDLVANNMPVFFIQDGIKFPDLVHAIKPEPDNEMPQASAAHDTFWDFASLMPESTHMLMWVLSDRALPRSYAMMEGFGVHTFRFINEKGKARFVKFHWKPLQGVHSITWDEAQKLAGKDPDFNRRDLWESIEKGNFPEFELGVQIVEEKDEHSFDFDLLDATKIIPEELVPVTPIGKMVLNRNPDNFFSETEQVAFHPGHVVPGIDFTNDPLLQGRLFSYLDTQLIRLGGPNFSEIPINRPVAEVHNNQRDGFMRQTINKGKAAYFPNSLGKGCPMLAPQKAGGYVHYMEKIEGNKVATRSESFKDHYSQAALFWRSLSAAEKQHLVDAIHFELGKVASEEVRSRMLENFGRVDSELARRAADGLGMKPPKVTVQDKALKKGKKSASRLASSIALSIDRPQSRSIKGRKVAVLAADGVSSKELMLVKNSLEKAGAEVEIISKDLGTLKSSEKKSIKVDKNYVTTGSVMYDALYIPGGDKSIATLALQGEAIHFILEVYKHCKPLAASGSGMDLLDIAGITELNVSEKGVREDKGVITIREASNLTTFNKEFERAIALHRHWQREDKDFIPA